MNNNTKAILCKLTSAFLFTVMAAFIQALPDDFPVGEVVFARSLFAFPVICLVMYFSGQFPKALKTQRVGGHLWRSVVGCLAMGATFAALFFLPLPDATALNYAQPIFSVIFAALILKETVRFYRWSAVIVGFIGILIMLLPAMDFSNQGFDDVRMLGSGFALLGAVLAALALTQVRALSKTESTYTIVFYFSLGATLLSLLTLPFGWVVPDLKTAVLLVLTGVSGGVAQLFLTQSFQLGDASLVAPFDYSAMLYALLIGYFLFDHVPEWFVLLGALVVIGSGLVVFYRERQLGIKRKVAPSAFKV